VRQCVEGNHAYLDTLADMLSQEFHPDLIINMDESWLTARSSKGSQKNCVFFGDSSVKPHFLEKQDVNYVTLTGAVTFSSDSLIPLLLSTRVHLQAMHIAGEFCCQHTGMGHLTGDAMDHWVDTVLDPICTACG
jgi:hypothetical protein